MHRILVDQQQIIKTRLDRAAPAPLRQGEARLKLQSFALTANNVTYAASGFAIGYWKFFPTDQQGQGLVPVWGVAQVVESQAADLAVGTRLYGFYPMAEELVITPKSDAQGAVLDIAPHRKDLPLIYNQYLPVLGSTPEQDHLRALLQPLLATSYLLFDWLMDNDWFGAGQIIIGSASSKTGLGLCKYLAELQGRPYRIVGLTSPRNRDFVQGLGACDSVLGYDEIGNVAQVPSVYVDMAGNSALKAQLHERLADHLRHSAAVGLSHWDKFDQNQALAGPKPQFFFAPAQVAKRREDWGAGVIEKQISQAWKRVASEASTWLNVRVHDGIGACETVYQALANGTADPRDGHIIRL
ncbi:MAG: hypothetical protein ACJAVM_000432 [Sulfitobacter sp.]|jgi:hypothetical protein